MIDTQSNLPKADEYMIYLQRLLYQAENVHNVLIVFKLRMFNDEIMTKQLRRLNLKKDFLITTPLQFLFDSNHDRFKHNRRDLIFKTSKPDAQIKLKRTCGGSTIREKKINKPGVLTY